MWKITAWHCWASTSTRQVYADYSGGLYSEFASVYRYQLPDPGANNYPPVVCVSDVSTLAWIQRSTSSVLPIHGSLKSLFWKAACPKGKGSLRTESHEGWYRSWWGKNEKWCSLHEHMEALCVHGAFQKPCSSCGGTFWWISLSLSRLVYVLSKNVGEKSREKILEK